MRTTRPVALALALTLGLAACGEDDGEPDDDQQARIDALEEDRDDARQEAQELADENERLEAEIAALREADEDDETEPANGPETPAEQRTPEGLVDQLRLRFEQDVPDDFDPGSTDWEPFELPEGAVGVHDTPGEAAAGLLESLEGPALGMDVWEATARALVDDEEPGQAYAAVLSWGWADDSVVGRDVRVTLTETDDGWETGGAEARHHCMRGVTDDDLCL